MSPLQLLLVAIGSALGGVMRAVVSYFAAMNFGTSFPWGTLAINIAGCFAIGLLYGLTEHDLYRKLLGVGVLGGFTTFSSFGWETLMLFQLRRPGWAIAYIGLSLALGLLLVWAGWGLAQLRRPA